MAKLLEFKLKTCGIEIKAKYEERIKRLSILHSFIKPQRIYRNLLLLIQIFVINTEEIYLFFIKNNRKIIGFQSQRNVVGNTWVKL